MRENKTRLVVSLALIQIALLAVSIPYYKLNGDEAWFAEEAYFMSQKGYSTSNLFAGYLKEDVRVVVQHKLFIYLGAALFKILHFSLWVFRLIPICSFILLMLLFTRYQRKQMSGTTTLQLFLSVSIVLAFHEFFYFAKIARPEMLVTLFGFLSYYLLNKYVSSQRYWMAALAGFTAGLAMLSHLNGSIFVGTGFVFLLLPLSGRFGWKKILTSVSFAAAALVAFSPYLIDIFLHYKIFLVQISSPLIIAKTKLTPLKPLIDLAREHERLFRKPEIFIASSLFFFHLLANRKKLFTGELRVLTIYTVILMVFLGMIVQDKQIKYATYLAPFWAILIAKSLLTMDTRKVALVAINAVLLGLYFATGLFWEGKSVFQKEDYPPLNRLIAKEIPYHSTCVAPMNFVFNEIANYKIFSDFLVGYEGFGKINIQSVWNFCRKNNCQYVVFNKYGDHWDYFPDFRDTGELLSDFEIVAANRDFAVLKFKDDSPLRAAGSDNGGSTPAPNQYLSYMKQRAIDGGQLAEAK